MKRLFLLIISISDSVVLLAQSVLQQRTDSVSRIVLKKFNEKDTAGLYELTVELLKSIKLFEDCLSVCNNNLFPLGEMKEARFEKETNGICKYKSVFVSMNVTFIAGAG